MGSLLKMGLHVLQYILTHFLNFYEKYILTNPIISANNKGTPYENCEESSDPQWP